MSVQHDSMAVTTRLDILAYSFVKSIFSILCNLDSWVHTLSHQAPKCGERCVQWESENTTLLQRVILLAAHLLYLHTHTNISNHLHVSRRHDFWQKMQTTKGWSKGRLHLHTFILCKNVPHPCHFLYGYVLTVCQTRNNIQDRNVYIILHCHTNDFYDVLYVSNTYLIHT